MFNIIDFYKNNKKSIYECFGNSITDRLYYEKNLSTNDVYTLISEIMNAPYDELNKKIEYMEHILFRYDCTNNINDSYTVLLCTANIVYISSQIAGIKITDYLSAYIFPGFPKNMDYCFKTTVVIVAGNVVVTSGVIRNGSIIWRKYLHFDSSCRGQDILTS